jgi:hypothetical protein
MPNPRGNVATLKKYQPKWRSGATQTIRVPIALTEKIFDYARKLDQGEEVQPDQSNSNAQLPRNIFHYDSQSLLQVIEKLNTILDTPRNNFSRDKKALLQSAIDELKSLVTSDMIQK